MTEQFHSTKTYTNGAPMLKSDATWRLWLGVAGYTSAGLVLLGLVGLVVLGGWLFVLMLAGMTVVGYGLIRACDLLEQRSERRKAEKRKKSAQPV